MKRFGIFSVVALIASCSFTIKTDEATWAETEICESGIEFGKVSTFEEEMEAHKDSTTDESLFEKLVSEYAKNGKAKMSFPTNWGYFTDGLSGSFTTIKQQLPGVERCEIEIDSWNDFSMVFSAAMIETTVRCFLKSGEIYEGAIIVWLEGLKLDRERNRLVLTEGRQSWVAKPLNWGIKWLKFEEELPLHDIGFDNKTGHYYLRVIKENQLERVTVCYWRFDCDLRTDERGYASVRLYNHRFAGKYKAATVLLPNDNDLLKWYAWIKKNRTAFEKSREDARGEKSKMREKPKPRRVLPPN
ncbi:MAG: hypothetical protein HYT03_02075 [Candidatus Harrisonbacteria bacterium]|nr:hypothetical protein [Candidatus Harrisonbacteria bacterium]